MQVGKWEWLLCYGSRVEVLAPEELREALVSETRRMARQYQIGAPRSEPELERLLRCWGKTSSNQPDYHPALFHMLDVGHVAQVLLQPPASARWRSVLAAALGTEPDMLTPWLPYVIAMHDIGKVSAAFQSQNEAQHKRLEMEGFGFDPWRGDLNVHHSQIGQLFVQDADFGFTIPDDLRQAWVDMIGGHHGQFQPRSAVKRVRAHVQRHEPADWQQRREVAHRELQKHLLAPMLYTLHQPSNISAATMALTGFTILCDWLGSDERFFHCRSGFDLESYLKQSQANARRAVESAGFLESPSSDAPVHFSDLFPDKHPPRPLQTAIDAVPQDVLTSPCLAIIEAPTGEGKTEAALALAHRIAQARGTDELYYALPTTATSNQMFKRLREHLHERLRLPLDVKLIHGQAFLVEDELRIEPLDNAAPTDRGAVAEWSTSKKRSILSPFGVGTVDQAELAALNVKHNALRLVGLAGKAVIFDEVHAYDTYMTTIVETLLQWFSALGTSVIILSATLPQAQRAVLARAYGVELGATSEEERAYPSLWVFASGHQPHHATPEAQQSSRPIRLHTLHLADANYEAKAAWLLEAVADGGCACWITNTVERAQQVYAALTSEPRPRIDLKLLHARFPLEQRQDLEERITSQYGPKGDRPRRGIVVGTQVLEQSLDLDFDVMVTDLAPIDFLLQRAGRLQRHDKHPRPPAYAGHPSLWLNVPLDDDGNLALGVDAAIYDEFLLRQTWLTLQAHLTTGINLPQDYRPLVEAVYGTVNVPPDSPLAEAWQELQRKQSHAIKEAQQRLIPPPDPEWSFCSRVARLTFEEDETSAAWIVAQTRLGRESINLIPLECDGDVACLYPTDETVALDRPASREMQLRLLRRHMRVSRPEIVRAVKNEPLPRLFTESPRLRGYYPLWLTEGKTRFPQEKGELVATLDRDLGLVI